MKKRNLSILDASGNICYSTFPVSDEKSLAFLPLMAVQNVNEHALNLPEISKVGGNDGTIFFIKKVCNYPFKRSFLLFSMKTVFMFCMSLSKIPWNMPIK